jgi:hypothetical protein
MILTAIDKLLLFAEKRLQSIVETDPNLKWESVVALTDVNVAHTLAALLAAEAVPTQVTSDSKLIGEALVWKIRVPVGMLERTYDLLSHSRFTEAELTYLATGVFSGDDDSRWAVERQSLELGCRKADGDRGRLRVDMSPLSIPLKPLRQMPVSKGKRGNPGFDKFRLAEAHDLR